MSMRDLTIRMLRKEFDRKIRELQKNCKHKKTKWMKEWWAFAHSTGNEVKVCSRCNKVLDTRKATKERKAVFMR